MKYKTRSGLLFIIFLIFSICFIARTGHVSAISVISATGGDGYTPIVYKTLSGQTQVYTIYHHRKPSGTATPNSNINCVSTTTSGICVGYPKYFSSTLGSSNTGVDDISTSFYPHYIMVGSKLYYAAQRSADNGIGCFDLEAGTNCGYIPLGTLVMNNSPNASAFDGLEQVGNRLYGIGEDVKAYCYDLNTLAACIGQPYDIAAGDATMPAYDGTSLRLPREVIGTNVYLVVNYWSQSTPADARLTCYDTLTDARCAGWTNGVDLAGTSTVAHEGIGSIFASYSTTGTANAVCIAGFGPDGPTCFDLNTSTPVTPLAGLMTGLPGSFAREETRFGNKTYFAFYQPNGGFADCYDFSVPARCAGFGGPHFWPSVNSGNTGDYGYTYSDLGCFFATGDAGIVWSFDPVTGNTGNTSCPGPSSNVLNSNLVIPKAMPDTGIIKNSFAWNYTIPVVSIAITSILILRRIRTKLYIKV